TLCSLLRAHVARRPDGDPSLGQRTGGSCRDRPRDPEVADDGMPGLEQDILGLDVPMYDVVHRDIKPENILFQAGHAVVSDFGIARAITAAAAGTLTETGIAIGTTGY